MSGLTTWQAVDTHSAEFSCDQIEHTSAHMTVAIGAAKILSLQTIFKTHVLVGINASLPQ